jgi:hypothetical protein
MKQPKILAMLLFLGVCLSAIPAIGGEGSSRVAFLVTGLSGGAKWQDTFDEAIEQLGSVLLKNGYTKEDLRIMVSKSGSRHGEIAGEKGALLEALDKAAEAQQPYEEVFFFIAGHADGKDERARFHLAEDDATFDEIAIKLDRIPAKAMVVIAATPQGHVWIERLSKPGRYIVAGNGLREYDYIPRLFLNFFPKILKKETDVGPGVSLRDVFLKVQVAVWRWSILNDYQLTEMAYLDADGDKQGKPLYRVDEDLLNKTMINGSHETVSEKNEPSQGSGPSSISKNVDIWKQSIPEQILIFEKEVSDAQVADKYLFKA